MGCLHIECGDMHIFFGVGWSFFRQAVVYLRVEKDDVPWTQSNSKTISRETETLHDFIVSDASIHVELVN